MTQNCLKIFLKTNNTINLIIMCKSFDSAFCSKFVFSHWPKTSLLLTVDAWILWQTQCRASGKYVFSPLCQSIALFSAPLTTPQHITFRTQIPVTNARELKTHYLKMLCSHWQSLMSIEISGENICPIEVQWQLQPTSTICLPLCKWRTTMQMCWNKIGQIP